MTGSLIKSDQAPFTAGAASTTRRITSNRLSVDQINVFDFVSALMWHTEKSESNTACIQLLRFEQRQAQFSAVVL